MEVMATRKSALSETRQSVTLKMMIIARCSLFVMFFQYRQRCIVTFSFLFSLRVIDGLNVVTSFAHLLHAPVSELSLALTWLKL